MALQNLQQYGCETGNKLKEKSRICICNKKGKKCSHPHFTRDLKPSQTSETLYPSEPLHSSLFFRLIF
jgi:hypothetical protein